jgi:hypothetical protein
MSTATSETAFTSTKDNLESQKARALQYGQKMKETQDAKLQQRYKQGALQALSARKNTRDTFTNIYKNLALTKAIETCPCYPNANKQVITFINEKKSQGQFTKNTQEQVKKMLTDICACYSEGKKAMEDYIKKSEELIAQHTPPAQNAGKTRRKKPKKHSRRKKRRTKHKK